MSVTDQPVNNVVWVDRQLLHANDYNPNHVAPPELKLLRLSIIEDGWTQPIVARPHDTEEGHFEVVDGYHRWTVSEDPKIWGLTDGLVPIVVVHPDPAHQRISTIRHNRARGVHGVLPMADIVADLIEEGLAPDEIKRRLGMDLEEVSRLLERGNMLKRGAGDDFGEAWAPEAKPPAPAPS